MKAPACWSAHLGQAAGHVAGGAHCFALQESGPRTELAAVGSVDPVLENWILPRLMQQFLARGPVLEISLLKY